MAESSKGDPPITAWDYAKFSMEVLTVILILVAVGTIGRRYLDIKVFRSFIDGLGVLAPLGFMALAACMVLLLIPPLVSIGVGTLAFGKLFGAAYALLGMTAGACLAFLAGRYLIGGTVAKLKRGRLKQIDGLIKRNGFLTVLGFRWGFLGIDMALNYVAGVSAVALRDYILGTLIGFIPRTIMWSYIFETLEELTWSAAALTDSRLMVVGILPVTRICGALLLGLVAMRYGKDPCGTT